jgi:hypothetical protein
MPCTRAFLGTFALNGGIMNETTIDMQFERSTKNKHRFIAPEGSPVSEVYVAKSAMPAPLPTITVVVKPAIAKGA